MKHNFRGRATLMSLFLLSACLITFASSAGTPQSTPERPVWDVQMARNAQANSTVTIQNQCQQTHSFNVTQENAPFLQLLAPAIVSVPGNGNSEFPVRFNSNGMNPGQYQGKVVVKCETCRKEKTCKQDRETLPIHLTIRPEDSRTTPENPGQLQVPGNIIGSQKPPNGVMNPQLLATSMPSYDPDNGDNKKKKAGEALVPTKDDDREFDEIPYTIPEGKDRQKCPCPAPTTKQAGGKTFIACADSDECKTNCGGVCRLYSAQKKTDPKKPKDKPKWKGGVYPGQAEKDKDLVYTCACSINKP